MYYNVNFSVASYCVTCIKLLNAGSTLTISSSYVCLTRFLALRFYAPKVHKPKN